MQTLAEGGLQEQLVGLKRKAAARRAKVGAEGVGVAPPGRGKEADWWSRAASPSTGRFLLGESKPSDSPY